MFQTKVHTVGCFETRTHDIRLPISTLALTPGFDQICSLKPSFNASQCLPRVEIVSLRSRARMEHFAFPFWMDIVIEPLCHWEENEHSVVRRGSRVYQLAINPPTQNNQQSFQLQYNFL